MYIICKDNFFWQVVDNGLLVLHASFFTWLFIKFPRPDDPLPLILIALITAIFIARIIWQATFFDIRIEGNEFLISNLYFKKRKVPVEQFHCIEEGWAMRTRYGTPQNTLSLRLKSGKKYRFAITSGSAADVEKRMREYLNNIVQHQ